MHTYDKLKLGIPEGGKDIFALLSHHIMSVLPLIKYLKIFQHKQLCNYLLEYY